MNRKQRRAQMRAQRHQKKAPKPEYTKLTREQRMDALVKNGITPKDLEKNFVDGYDVGYKAGCEASIKTVYAAVCIALNENHGFGRKRCADILNAVDNHVIYSLTSTDAIEEVWKRMKLELDFNDPIQRILETE